MNEILKNRAKKLRKKHSNAEKLLWHWLRDKRLNGYKFRRQRIIGPYIVDFICISKRLIIELDGGQHSETQNYDKERTLFLENKGYKVLRFWNDVVFIETENVLNMILNILNDQNFI